MCGRWRVAKRDPSEIGRFRIRELLGAGGFGHVYRAYDPKLDRTIALKIPRSVFSTRQEEERFLREARSAAQLRHPGIVPVHETGQEEGLPYVVSEYIDGHSLTERLRAKDYSCSEAAELVARLADALEYAHQQKVIHRDIKPGNILIDVEGQPHLADFGLARRDDGEKTLTETGQIVGTPAYMSPEQATGQQEKVGAQSDIYSLGVVLYELLTGRLSFQGEKLELLRRIVEDEPRSPRFWNPRVPRDLETITLKCLEKEPPRRYLSAGALAQDLRHWDAGEPIRARPVSRSERCWRWCRRNPVVAGLGATVALLLISLAAVLVRLAMTTGGPGPVEGTAEHVDAEPIQTESAAADNEQQTAASDTGLNLTGAWRSNLGSAVLEQAGDKISGTVNVVFFGKSRITGTINAQQIDFTYAAVEKPDRGRGVLKISPDGQQLRGWFQNDQTGFTWDWNLRRQ